MSVATASYVETSEYTTRWDVTNNGASAYRFAGNGVGASDDNPTLYLTRGEKYLFNANVSGHPFQIRVSDGGSAYNDGITNNGVQTGDIIFEVQMDAPTSLVYQCTIHSGMVGNIYIGDPQTFTPAGISGSFTEASSSFSTRVTSNETNITDLTTVTGSYATTGSNSFIGDQNITGHITASGNISASGDVITQKVGIIDGAGIGFGANFASGNEDSDVQIFTDAGGEINFVKNNTTVLAINSGNNISINSSYFLDQPLNVANNITSSGNISASGYISASSFNATPGTVNQLTASYAVTASTTETIIPRTNFKPIITHTANFTTSASFAGHYNMVGGNLQVTVTTASNDLVSGYEWDFFQTGSGDTFEFVAGTGVSIVSRSNNKKLAAVGSAATLKYISGETFHLVGDLTT